MVYFDDEVKEEFSENSESYLDNEIEEESSNGLEWMSDYDINSGLY